MCKDSRRLQSYAIDCEQVLFCSKIRGEESKTSERASVTCEPRIPRASSRPGVPRGRRVLGDLLYPGMLHPRVRFQASGIYKRVGISQVGEYERVVKSVIQAFEKYLN